MYYFVFEQPHNNQISRLHDHIRSTLEDLKIIKEAVKANPVQSPEELTQEGLDKKFTTIVAVGGDNTINKVASIVAQNSKIALGIIPTSPKSTFKELLGIHNWQQGCEILPARKLIVSDMAEIEGSYFFLTHVELLPGFTNEGYSSKQASFEIDFGLYQVQIKTSSLVVTNALINSENGQVIKSTLDDGLIDVVIPPQQTKNSSGLLNLFTNETEKDKKSLSIFHTQAVQISADVSVPIVSEKEIIAKTPTKFKIADLSLKIISKKQTS
ncbi:diacylglycerol kinase family protein [Patescibacteria group bacterium]